MRKIPTLFVRDPQDMKRVLPEVNPACAWVLAGEGVATRKYDGTCVLIETQDPTRTVWARREVNPGREAPPNFREVDSDPVTGKRVGWEPATQSGWNKFIAEALADLGAPPAGTYELTGPKVNKNPDRLHERHVLTRHADAVRLSLDPADLTFDAIRDILWMLHDEDHWEGIVWHHPDGRMAKLKARDFPRGVNPAHRGEMMHP